MHQIPDPSDGDTPIYFSPEKTEAKRLYTRAQSLKAESHNFPMPPKEDELVEVTSLTREQILQWGVSQYTQEQLYGGEVTVPNTEDCVHVVAVNEGAPFTARIYFQKKDGTPECVVWAS